MPIQAQVRIAETRPGDVIVRHPDHPYRKGTWTVTGISPAECSDGRVVRVDYRDGMGLAGCFAAPRGTRVWVEREI